MKLSKTFLPDVDRLGKTYDGIPTNMMWCFANNLKYKPNPFLILSLACSKQLDKEAAKYFASDNSPDYLFCEFLTLCGMHMLFENPKAWQNIFDFYQIYKFDSQKQVLLLAKKKGVQLSSIKPAGQFLYNAGQWCSVPENNNLLYCSFDFQLNMWGRICQFFYKTPAVFFNVKYADGQIQSFKFVPVVSKHAVLINYLPEDLYALTELFAHRATNHVIAFQLLGPGLGYYQSSIPALWMQSENKIAETHILHTISAPFFGANERNFVFDNIMMVSSGRDQISSVRLGIDVPSFNDGDGVVDLCLGVFEKDKKTPVKAVFVQIDHSIPTKTASRILAVGLRGRFPCRESVTAGFKTGIDIGSLRPGRHVVNLIIQSQNDGKLYYEPGVVAFATK